MIDKLISEDSNKDSHKRIITALYAIVKLAAEEEYDGDKESLELFLRDCFEDSLKGVKNDF